ncbi:hypothetical protein L596_004156 [Steinernema carpocapsae]|uniref:Rootletin-like coiled-coil domain-containing protein n=2 Tax=Steinernema carpocapsae TaxID=34508 RepID=A0A4U8UZ06_STECR|nr:hypothetical protein L596_004156 [Steinernema carpocapsae]
MLFTSGGSTSPNSHISTVSPNNDQSPNQGDRSGRSTPSSVESSGNTLSITTEPIVPGQWTNVNSKVRIKQLTVSETKAIFALQKSHQEERRVSISATFKAPEVKETKLEKPMEETSESGTTTGGTKRITTTSETIHHRIPDSPGSRSNYGEFYWDTNGENNYHPSDSFDSDLMLELDALEGRGLSTARLDRTHDDLNKYKQRIDANVEQQREYSEMMAALQQKVQEYRKHIAELEGKMVSQRARHGQDPSSFSILDSNVLTDIRYGAGGAPIGGDTNISHTNIEMWTPSRKFLDTTGDSNANFEIIARLDEERRRNDDYRTQLENERQQNNQLQHQIENLRVDYDRDVREKERHYQNREKNLALYLSEEQKKMLDLWAEVQRMRRHFADLKEQTERDLENQKNDFTKAYRTLTGLTRSFSQGNIAGLGGLGGMGGHGGMGGMGGVGGVGGVVGGLSGLGGYGGTDTRDLISQPLLMSGDGGGGSTTVNINHDTVLYETVRRLQERGGRGGAGSNLAADLQLLTQLRSQGGGAGDAELHNELMKKYEESIERNIELESKGDDCQRKIAEMEAELRRTRDRLNDNQVSTKEQRETSLCGQTLEAVSRKHAVSKSVSHHFASSISHILAFFSAGSARISKIPTNYAI